MNSKKISILTMAENPMPLFVTMSEVIRCGGLENPYVPEKHKFIIRRRVMERHTEANVKGFIKILHAKIGAAIFYKAVPKFIKALCKCKAFDSHVKAAYLWHCLKRVSKKDDSGHLADQLRDIIKKEEYVHESGR